MVSQLAPKIKCALVDALAFSSVRNKKTRSYFLILVTGLLTLTLRKLILLKIAIPKSPLKACSAIRSGGITRIRILHFEQRTGNKV